MKNLTAIEANAAKTAQTVALLEERLATSKYFRNDGGDLRIVTKDWDGRRTYIKINRYTAGMHNFTGTMECGYIEGGEYVAIKGRRCYDIENDWF